MIYDSFTKDKEAYVVKTLLAENQFFSELINAGLDSHESYITDKVAGRSLEALKAWSPIKHKNGEGVIGAGVILKDGIIPLAYSDAFSLDNVKAFKESQSQLEILDLEAGHFAYFLKLKGSDDKAFVVFRDTKISQYLADGSYKKSFIKTPENNLLGQGTNELPAEKYLKNHDKLPFGLIKIEGEMPYFVTYSHLKLKGYTLFTTIKNQQLFSYKTVFILQTAGFVMLFISVCCLIGVICANWLTKNLNILSDAAKSFEKEDFDHKIEIQSDDEFAVLGSTFNDMGTKISTLLTDLRRYNTHLEEMVEARTVEVKNLSRIQNAMLNSLGQSFTIFDGEMAVKPVYSKISHSMYDMDPVSLGAMGIMSVDQNESEMVGEFVKQIFLESIPFEQLVELLPTQRSNSKNESIMLEYAPIRNEETGQIEFIMVVGTDKTQEFLSMKQTEKEIQFSKMLLSIMKNPVALKRILKDSLKALSELNFTADLGHKELVKSIRTVHTIKGNFSVFRVKEVSDSAHVIEDKLEQIIQTTQSYPVESFNTDMNSLMNAIESFIETHGDLVKYHANSEVTVSMKDIMEFKNSLKDPSVARSFEEIFMARRFGEFFDLYPGYVEDLCARLGKKVKFHVMGSHQAVPEWFPVSVFSDFIHLLRNSLDHGIETPKQRLAAGKDEQGQIVMSFASTINGFEVKFADDGRGIDVEALSQKDPSIKTMDDAIQKLIMGGISAKESVSDVSGRGVGLSAIVQKVSETGGSYEVNSTPGKGTVFTFKFSKIAVSKAA